jgi:AraC-like DNA-binding protein
MKSIDIHKRTSADFGQPVASPFYQIMMFCGNGTFAVDFTEYHFTDHTILFLAPYQHFQWKEQDIINIDCLEFHGDFYCIEYHKKEVACNGLLFNNVYLFPHITIDAQCYNEILTLFSKIEVEKSSGNEFSTAILKAYLQLILALCSKEKNRLLANIPLETIETQEIGNFQKLLEQHFLNEKSVSFYASEIGLSTDTFSKKIKKQFGKTPTQLIQDRVVLEAKKLLHLTYKSVKEIAFELNFEDEFYFSRYFKKSVGLSPLHYRENVGISIVAK